MKKMHQRHGWNVIQVLHQGEKGYAVINVLTRGSESTWSSLPFCNHHDKVNASNLFYIEKTHRG